MILVDANLLLYAKFLDLPQHGRARDWLDGRLAGPARVGLPWPSLLAFLRIGTNPRAFARPMAAADAWRQVQDWLAAPCAWVPVPTDRHAEVLSTIYEQAHPAGDLVPDAHLAALAVEHGLTLCSTDADFARFPGVRWVNPLA